MRTLVIALLALALFAESVEGQRVRILTAVHMEREENLLERTLQRYLQTRLEALGFDVVASYEPDPPAALQIHHSVMRVEGTRYDVAAAIVVMGEDEQFTGPHGFDWYQAHAIEDLDQAARRIAEGVFANRDIYFRERG